MNERLPILAVAVLFLAAACSTTTAPGTVTASQQTWAAATEDAISIGLVPVLARNPSYVAAASGVAAALGSFSGSTITPDDVNAFLAKTPLSPADAKVAAGVINAAWAVYVRHYQQSAGSALRPDVKLFLNAVANGITEAAAAVPRG